jgi:hypothetical protein
MRHARFLSSNTMKQLLTKSTVVLVLILITGTILSCSTSTGPHKEVTQLRVDSVLATDSVSIGDTLTIGLATMLDCYGKVRRVDTTYRSLTLSIAAFDTIVVWPDRPWIPCLFRSRRFYVTFLPTERGILTVLAIQPSGSYLADSIIVR